MAELLDKETGQLVTVDDAQVGEFYATGRYGVKPGTRVPVLNDAGELGSVAVEALDSGDASAAGMRVAGAEDVILAREVAEFTGAGEQAKTVAEGFVGEGLTLGLGTAAGIESGLIDRERSLKRREHNPGLFAGSTIAGAVAPLLVSGGASGALQGAGLLARGGQALRVAGALPRAVASVGRGVEAGVQVALGAERAAGVLGTGLRLGAAGAAEGALLGAGHAVSESSLHDTDLTAEALIAGAADGALLGGATGGILGAGGKALLRGSEAALGGVMNRVRAQFTDEAIGRFANEQAIQAARAGKRALGDGFERIGGAQAVGRAGLEEGIITATNNADDQLVRATAKVEEWGQRIGAISQRIDEAAVTNATIRPSSQRISDRVKAEVLDKLDATGFGTLSNAQRQVTRELSPFFKRLRMSDEPGAALADLSFSEMHQARKALDSVVYRNEKAGSTAIEELRKVRAIFEQELEASADKAVSAIGDDAFGATYQQAKQKYSAMRWWQDVAEDNVKRDTANRYNSLTDYLGAGVGASAIGGLPGLAVGMAIGQVNKFVREHGRQLLAVGASKAAGVARVAEHSTAIERRVERSVKSFISGTVKAAKSAPIITEKARETRASRYARMTRDVAALSSNPGAMAAQTQDRFGQHGENMPGLAMAYGATQARGVSFLQSKMPRARVRSSTLRPDLDKTQRVSDSEQAKWLRYVDAVKDPMGVVDALERGDVPREGVEALRAVYPKQYQQLLAKVTERVAEAKEPLPYAKVLQLSILFGTAMHPSMEPGFIAAAQATYAAPQEQSQDQGLLAPSKRNAPNTSSMHQTKTERLSGA